MFRCEIKLLIYSSWKLYCYLYIMLLVREKKLVLAYCGNLLVLCMWLRAFDLESLYSSNDDNIYLIHYLDLTILIHQVWDVTCHVIHINMKEATI